MPPIGPEAPHPIPAGMKVNKKNKYEDYDLTELSNLVIILLQT